MRALARITSVNSSKVMKYTIIFLKNSFKFYLLFMYLYEHNVMKKKTTIWKISSISCIILCFIIILVAVPNLYFNKLINIQKYLTFKINKMYVYSIWSILFIKQNHTFNRTSKYIDTSICVI